MRDDIGMPDLIAAEAMYSGSDFVRLDTNTADCGKGGQLQAGRDTFNRLTQIAVPMLPPTLCGERVRC